MPLDFGAIAPCRTCNGTGKSRNPAWGDKQPVEVVACIECSGTGYLPAPVADKARVGRDEDRASIAGERP